MSSWDAIGMGSEKSSPSRDHNGAVRLRQRETLPHGRGTVSIYSFRTPSTIAIALALAATGLVGVRVACAQPEPKKPGPLFTDEQEDPWERRPTAEQLLSELRRTRPLNNVILPTGASRGSNSPVTLKLMPEGSSVVDRAGRLRLSGSWWTFVFEPAEGDAPIKILPNAALEVLVRTAGGAASPPAFVVTGEVTVFEGENYLLVRLARRSTVGASTAAPPEAASTTDDERKSDATPGSTDSAEAVLAAMQQQAPAAPVIPVPPRTARGSSAATRTLIPDGAPLVRRPGRIVYDGQWWTFNFESDGPNHPEPPMKLLVNRTVELMLHDSRRGEDGLVFLVSGEVTAFQGDNYLLPRAAMRRTDAGNLRK